MSRNGKALVRHPYFWLAWYPMRRLRCQFGRDEVRDDIGWHFSAALGPLYFGTGSGVPLP